MFFSVSCGVSFARATSGLEKFPNNHAYGIRRPPAAADQLPSFYWISYRQAHEQIKEIALGLKALGQFNLLSRLCIV